MFDFVHKCRRSESQLINFIVRHGILLGPLDYVIGRNVLNCALRYHISLDSIMNTDIQPQDIIGRINVNDNHLAVLPLLWELLRCRDGTLCLSNHNFVMSDIITMINYLCTF